MTRVIRVDPENPDLDLLREVAEVARNGGLVAFPTETVYGLGTNAFKEDSVRRIFEVKRRPPDNPVSVLVSDPDQVEKIGRVNDVALKLIREFFPGPITVVVDGKDIPDVVTAGTGKVAVRMPDHPIALKIVEFAGVPLATPSANVSGKPSPTSADHVLQDFMGKIDIVVDGGETGIGIESTVVDTTTAPPRIIRPGAIPPEEIERVVGKVEVSEAPSMRYAHYKSKAKVIVVFGDDKERVVEKIKEIAEAYRRRGLKVGVGLREVEDVNADVKIRLGSDIREYARNLFKTLRKFDEVDVGIIEGVEGRGLALAVKHRLVKASDEVIRV